MRGSIRELIASLRMAQEIMPDAVWGIVEINEGGSQGGIHLRLALFPPTVKHRIEDSDSRTAMDELGWYPLPPTELNGEVWILKG